MEHKIQVLSLRDWTTPDGVVTKTDRRHFKAGWRADSVEELFANCEEFVKRIPKHERWNLYYTASHCFEDVGRRFVSQSIIPLDIDGIDTNDIDKYIDVICNELGLDKTKTGIVATGNGLQIIIGLKNPITSVEYFNDARGYYKALCGRINTCLFEHGLVGDADPSVFSGGRLLRLPFTKNIKKDKGEKYATLINGTIVPSKFNLVKASGLPELIESDHLNNKALARLPKPDTIGVQEGCGFLKHCKDNQNSISEPQWYAMLSIIGRLEGGAELVHEYSKGHETYDPDKTDIKMAQALEASGPRTCENIDTMFDGCVSCDHWRQIKSPIQIRGADFIATKDTGFWNTVTTKDGVVKRTTPCFEDLVTYYDTLHKHTVIRETELVYHWNDKYWQLREKIDMNAFIERNLQPPPNMNHCSEFVSKMKRTNVQPTSWMTVEGKVNLDNGVIDVSTGEFTEHDIQYGFPYCLPFNYDPSAKAPRWEEFIEEVTLGREELKLVLQEIVGMCISFVDPTLVQKAVVLLGNGANGKSVFLNIVKDLLGVENYSVVNLGEASAIPTRRVALVSKMANITEETPRVAFMESSFFKDIVSGGEIEAHKMYHGPFKFKNTAKILMACNELPQIQDISNGMKRRLIILPFDRTFSREEQDPLLPNKLREEIPGIFNWAMTGLRRLRKNHWKFSEGEIIANEVEMGLYADNPVHDWADENLEIGNPNNFEPLKELFDEYCMNNRSDKVTYKLFSKLIRAHIAKTVGINKLETRVVKVGGKPIRTIPYVSMRERNDAEY